MSLVYKIVYFTSIMLNVKTAGKQRLRVLLMYFGVY